MDTGAMWLVALVITATVSGESQMANSSSYLDAAITGFDPFYMTALTQPNPGRRSKIFQPLATLSNDDKTALNSFINERLDETYLPEITVQKAGNFTEYLDFTASAVYELPSNADCVKPIHRTANNSSCTNKNHQRDSAMLQFFKDTGGDALFAKTDIVTHTITISSFVITTFNPAFEKAVETLYKAVVNPDPEKMKSTFNEFVRLYGTHFSRRTLLGSRAILGKLFSTRAATVEEDTARRRCVLAAAREALTPCMRGCNETTQTVFSRASEKCGGEEHEPVVAVTGPLPERTLDDWSSSAKDSPNPLFHELEPLSTLFTAEWFDAYFDRIQVRINGNILSHYFEASVSDYSRRMAIGGSNCCIPRKDAVTTSTTTGTTTSIPKTTSTKKTTTTSTETTFPKTTTTDTTSVSSTSAPTTTTTTSMRECSESAPAGQGKLHALLGPPQTLTSHPGFGSSNYDDNVRLTCRLYASTFQVRLKILSFNTEKNYDNLIIYDGPETYYGRLAVLSGTPNLTTYVFTSTNRDLLLHFVTGGVATGPGFSLTYEEVL